MTQGRILTRRQRALRRYLKRFLYFQLYMRDAFLVLFGRAKPFIPFKVEGSPPPLYLNFEVPADRVSALAEHLALPPGLELAPIRCLEGEAPCHYITLNLYRVSGITNGLRAEWSVYVSDAEGVPRYLVVEARSDAGSMDPVDVITRPGVVEYDVEADDLVSRVEAASGVLEARCPDFARSNDEVRAAPEWIEANDYIYWRNGICDRTLYDTGLAHARMTALAPQSVKVRDETEWGRFVDPTPRSVVVFHGAIEFMISPWWNVDEVVVRDA